jgi:type IV secretion system protein VirB4
MNNKSESITAELVPYSTHVHPQVVKTTGGDYLVCFYLQGLPFVGRDEWEIEHKHANFNRLVQSLRAPAYTNLSYWIHDVRRNKKIKLPARFAHQFNQDLHDQYMEGLNKVHVMQNELYLTLIYRPVDPAFTKLTKLSSTLEGVKQEELAHISKILELADSLQATLYDYLPYRMGTYESPQGILFSEVLEFFGYLVNRAEEPVPVLAAPIRNYLATSQLVFNEKTGIHMVRTANGKSHIGAILNIKEYTDITYPGILNELKYVGFEYVVTHSFTPLGRQDALTVLERTKGRMIATQDRAVSQIVELDSAMDGLSSGNFILGQYHFTMTIYASSVEEVEKNISMARAALSNAGFVSVREDIASVGAFYAQLPCNWSCRTRKMNASSLNFLGLSPLHNFATGKQYNNPWGNAVTVLQTNNGQPYFFNFHATAANENSFDEKALGNTMVIGKSGTGKTALINFLLSQVQKYDPQPTIFFFDKDRGAEIFIRACHGRYLAVESGVPTGFNPFQCENSEANTLFLVDLVKLMAGKIKYSSAEDEDILRAVNSILDSPLPLRTLTNFQTSLPNLGEDSVYACLKKWTRTGYLGWIFDNPSDQIEFEGANIIGFDYTALIDLPLVRVPVITYLIHRMEKLIDGRRFIFVMDEFWKILDGEGGLKEFARNKLKTIRKQNGLGIFATQSPEDALKSDIAAALVEQTATLILLPNPNADRRDYVEGLKLSDAEYKIVRELDERSRSFLVKQGHHSALCQLKLGDMPDALSVISASTDNIEVMRTLITQAQLSLSGDAKSLGNDSAFEAISADCWLPDFYRLRKGAEVRT